ncbi:MAG: M20/M25/M40 family metallo-hydrolase [Phycisphaeraceae bacterium]
MAQADPTLSDRETKLLLQLTALPTASGRESSVMVFVRDWVQRRRGLKLQRDAAGNLLITRSDCKAAPRPVVFVAHMDHPAFVLRKPIDDTGRRVEAEFRGGVEEAYFRGSRVRLWKAGKPGIAGTVVETRFDPAKRYDITATIELDQAGTTQPGQIATWDLPAPRIDDGRLTAPVCDNLAGVAAALAAMDRVRSGKSRDLDLRVLLTRAEESGFVGAVSACKNHTLPKASRIVVLENSKAYDESPSGGGTILRVGDRTSTFDADVTRRLGVAASHLENADPPLKWMRRLMSGGTCEATAFVAFGYRAGCVCLPLVNYHNMDTATGRIASESIALSDYEATIRLLAEATDHLAAGSSPVLRKQLSKLHSDQKWLLES